MTSSAPTSPAPALNPMTPTAAPSGATATTAPRGSARPAARRSAPSATGRESDGVLLMEPMRRAVACRRRSQRSQEGAGQVALVGEADVPRDGRDGGVWTCHEQLGSSVDPHPAHIGRQRLVVDAAKRACQAIRLDAYR